LSEGHEVKRRPRAAPVSITVQGPWQIAATGFSGIEERLRKGNCIWLNAKRVRVDNAAWQQQRVEIFRLGLIELHINRQL
jgi:hypothetical protein